MLRASINNNYLMMSTLISVLIKFYRSKKSL